VREFCDAVDSDKHVPFAAGDLHFGAVDVYETQFRAFVVPALQAVG
jgi:hypothetical protein